MGAADGFPVASDVDDVDAGANDMLELRTGARERACDVGESLTRLRSGVANADELAVAAGCCRAGDVNPLTDAHRTGIADDRLPGGAGREVLTGNRGQGDGGTDLLGSAGVREAHGAAGAALESTVYCAGIVDEIQPRPRIASEKLSWQEIAFEAITAAARGDKIAWRVHTALGQR